LDVDQFRTARARWKPLVDSVLGAATEQMFNMAKLSVGDTVLDIGAGAGAQSLEAAGRVGGSGRVVATDIAADLLEIAAADARAVGFATLECRVMNAEELDFASDSFDAVISRNALMYIPDISRALNGVHRVMRSGGRFASIVWSTPDHNGFLSAFERTMTEHLRACGINMLMPDPFRFGQHGSLESLLVSAGLVNVRTRVVPAPWRLRSAEAALDFLRGNPSYLLRAAQELPESVLAAAWAEIRQKLQRYDSPSGFVAPGELVVVAAKKR